jgi:hypothetical protein
MCPNCGSDRVQWDSWFTTTIPTTGNYIPFPKLILVCEECSETIRSVDLDGVAKFLNEMMKGPSS